MANLSSIDETLVVTVGLLGKAETAMGTAHVHLESADGGPLSDQEVGTALGLAWKQAYVDAVRSFAPRMTEHWIDQEKRERGPSV